MEFRQRKIVAAAHRVQVFLDTRGDRLGPVKDGGARSVLDEVVATLEALGGQQDPTRFQRKHELQEEKNAKHELREGHMRLIATIAEVSLREVPEFERLRMPEERFDTTTNVLWAREMAKAAEPYQDVFLKHGLAPDFIASLHAAVDAAQKAIDQRWRAHTSRVGATAAVEAEARRAFRLIDVIDAQIAPKLKGDDQLLRDWELTKRIAQRTLAAAAPAAPAGTEPAVSATPALTIIPGGSPGLTTTSAPTEAAA
jgi:hypothetical protein